jgi:hypothetical protein
VRGFIALAVGFIISTVLIQKYSPYCSNDYYSGDNSATSSCYGVRIGGEFGIIIAVVWIYMRIPVWYRARRFKRWIKTFS